MQCKRMNLLLCRLLNLGSSLEVLLNLVGSYCTNLVFQWTFSFFVKHFMHLSLGFAIMYAVHKIPYRYFKGLSMVLIPVVLVLLLITILQGSTNSQGTNTSRWIQIPIVNMSFQTSFIFMVKYIVLNEL